MKKLLNTLYVTSENSYLSLDGENIVILFEDGTEKRFPLHVLEGIFYFGYKGASPALMGACCERGIRLAFMRPNGRFLAACSGENNGNVLLRKEQYRISESANEALSVSKNFITGKIYNARWVLERLLRDHGERVDREKVTEISVYLKEKLSECRECADEDTLRGIEGVCSSRYFSVFNEMILRNKESFSFTVRSRRPPLDNINAMLSFCYTLLANECASALTCVGLDPYVGFMHTDKPGRKSLALDLMEELRCVFADRFTVSLINNKIASPEDFSVKESGAVIMSDEFRKTLISEWQKKKQENITHPYLGEKIEWGLVPYVQAMLLARFIRGDLDAYPPFLWK